MPAPESQLQKGERIGGGAHGEVFCGMWNTLEVAVKTLQFHGSEGGDVLEKYATSCISCNHKHIIKTYQRFWRVPKGLDTPNSSQFEILELVQEFCDGGNLNSAVQAGFFMHPQNEVHSDHVGQVVWEISAGLRYLHGKSIVHGDLNPCNVLLKSAASGAERHPSRAEAHEDPHVRAHYESLSHGFITKISDHSLALTVLQAGIRAAAPHPGAQFYVAPEARELDKYSTASDIYSLGVLMWEVYHSHPPFMHTPRGFVIQFTTFPMFEEGANLPYAILACACLNQDPALRPDIEKVVTILQDVITGAGVQCPADKVPVAADGGTAITERTRETLGEGADNYRHSPRWQGVLEELNGIKSHNVLDLLAKNRLENIINLPPPVRRKGDTPTSESPPPAKLVSGSPSAGVRRHAFRSSGGRVPGAVVERAGSCSWEDWLFGDASKPLPSKRTIDHHGIPERSGDATSDEDIDEFQDAKEELMKGDNSFFMCGFFPSTGGVSPRGRQPGGVAVHPDCHLVRDHSTITNRSPGTAEAVQAAGHSVQSPRPLSSTSMGGNSVGALNNSMEAHLMRSAGVITPAGTGELVSSRSNVSMVSDWDQVESRKDEFGKTRFNIQRFQSQFVGRGAKKGARGAADAASHGHHMSSTALTSTNSAIDSNPGTPIMSQTLDVPSGPDTDPGITVRALQASVGHIGRPNWPAPNSAANSELAQAHMLLSEGPFPAPGPREDSNPALDDDEDAAQWKGDQARQQMRGGQRRMGLDATTTHPTSGGSNSSLSSMSVAQGGSRLNARIGSKPGNVRGLTSSELEAAKQAESNMGLDPHLQVSVSSFANSTLERMPPPLQGPGGSGRPPFEGQPRADVPRDPTGGPRASGPLSGDRGVGHVATSAPSSRSFAARHLESPITIPNAIVKSSAARSFDGFRLGEFRPMQMRSDRVQSFDSSAPPRAGSVKSVQLGPSTRGASEDGGASQVLMGLHSLFDSVNASDGEGSNHDHPGLTDVMQKAGDGSPLKDDDEDSRQDEKRSAGGAPDAAPPTPPAKAKREHGKAAASANNLEVDLDKLALQNQAAQSGNDGSPLSLRNLDVSNVGSSLDTHSPPFAASLDTPSEAALVPGGAVSRPGPATMSPSTLSRQHPPPRRASGLQIKQQNDVRRHIHPLLVSNRAAIAHVESIESGKREGSSSLSRSRKGGEQSDKGHARSSKPPRAK